jgi:3-hydroxyisobutyrate dehydrogenase-like beta-hydroxyacid dehydrogenase
MQTSTLPRIGLIGLGLMGHGIGRNLLKNGYPLTVLGHVNRKPVESLVGLGAVEAADASALARGSDIVILCVTGSPQVEAQVYGDKGILASIRAGHIVIDCSTSEPRSSANINRDLLAAGAHFVDAPLGRTPAEAEAGKLNTMVGASPELLETIRPVLSAFCENIIHVGEVLSAQKLKLINNFAIVGTVSLLSEALRTCREVGVPPDALLSLMSKGPLNSGLLQAVVGEVLKGNYEGMKFSIGNASKDMQYFNNLVAEFSTPDSLAADVARVLERAAKGGLSEKFLPELARGR